MVFSKYFVVPIFYFYKRVKLFLWFKENNLKIHIFFTYNVYFQFIFLNITIFFLIRPFPGGEGAKKSLGGGGGGYLPPRHLRHCCHLGGNWINERIIEHYRWKLYWNNIQINLSVDKWYINIMQINMNNNAALSGKFWLR